MTGARRILTGAVLAFATIGALLLGSAGAAIASPIPGIPLTTDKLCVGGGGRVMPAPGSQMCQGGGDTGDVVISQAAADALVSTDPKPQKPHVEPAPPKPAPPKPGPPAPAPPKPGPPAPSQAAAHH